VNARLGKHRLNNAIHTACSKAGALTPIGGERRAVETGLVQQVDRRRSAATEPDHVLEPFRGSNGFDQCPSDASAGAENDRLVRLRKRLKINPGNHCALGFDLPSHRRLAPWLAHGCPEVLDRHTQRDEGAEEAIGELD
jgi:hypothetical protein